MNQPTYILYGSYASYFTAKVRAYLRKKGVPFVERLPSDPQFRDTVRPASGSHRIPQLFTPEGQVIQDSIEIVDFLEARFPELPAFPTTPLQRTYVHLMELLGSEGLLRLAWLHRWVFAENQPFVKMDFGRSFKPQGDDDALAHYGNLIADRMMSYGLPESTAEFREQLDGEYQALLSLFEAHLIEHPYLLGGHPSAADYAVMGALHAHMGRDPAGLRVMQNHAPRTFRWVEHMLVPEVVAPEFFDRAVSFLPDDEVPATALALLAHIGEAYGESFVCDVLAFDRAMNSSDVQPGHLLDADHDQPQLPKQSVSYRGKDRPTRSNLHAVWIAQRAQTYFQTLSASAQTRVAERLGSQVACDLLQAPLRYRLQRDNNRLVINSIHP